MDNQKFDVTGVGFDPLLETLRLAFSRMSHKAKGWLILGDKIVLYWAKPNGVEFNEFPVPMSADDVVRFIMAWLSNEDCPYPPVQDFDGTAKQGWRVYCEDWGHVDKQWQAFLAIAPYIAMYGK